MEKTYTLTLTESEVMQIGNTLAELQYKVVADLLFKISQQIQEQNRDADQPS
jgi:hypothetical protein